MRVVERYVGQHRAQAIDVAHSEEGIEVRIENGDDDRYGMDVLAGRVGQSAIRRTVATVLPPVGARIDVAGNVIQRIAYDRPLHATANGGVARVHDPARLERLVDEV